MKYSQNLKKEYNSWLKTITSVSIVFILFITITSWINHVFSFPILPIFNNSLEGFRAFTEFVFNTLFFKWITLGLNLLLHWLEDAFINLFKVNVIFPTIVFPRWIHDLALFSGILLRAQNRAMKSYNPVTVHSMPVKSKDDLKNKINKSHILIKSSIKIFWQLVMISYLTSKFISYPFRYLKFKKVSNGVEYFIGSALMLGIFFFIHDFFIVIATKLGSEDYVASHRRFMTNMAYSILAALGASTLFFLINGFLIMD